MSAVSSAANGRPFSRGLFIPPSLPGRDRLSHRLRDDESHRLRATAAHIPADEIFHWADQFLRSDRERGRQTKGSGKDERRPAGGKVIPFSSSRILPWARANRSAVHGGFAGWTLTTTKPRQMTLSARCGAKPTAMYFIRNSPSRFHRAIRWPMFSMNQWNCPTRWENHDEPFNDSKIRDRRGAGD